MLAYLGLFASALLAATVIPAQSEGLLVGMLLSGKFQAWLLLAVASLGNVLGSILNWLLGRFAAHLGDRWWFPASGKRMAQAEAWYHRYGRWTLLLSWMPIVGDPLTVVAGVLREPIVSFVLIVALAKTTRYLVLAAITLGWL